MGYFPEDLKMHDPWSQRAATESTWGGSGLTPFQFTGSQPGAQGDGCLCVQCK